MKKVVIFAALLSIAGCSPEQPAPNVVAPTVEATPSPGEVIVQQLNAALSASPSDIVVSLQEGKELRTLSQAQSFSNEAGFGLEAWLDKLEKDFVSDRILGVASSGDKKLNVEFRKSNGLWSVSTSEQSLIVSQRGFIERIREELSQQLKSSGETIHNEFFFVTFQGNPEPFDSISGERKLNEIFREKGFSSVVEVTATLRGTAKNGEERKVVKDYRISLTMTPKN